MLRKNSSGSHVACNAGISFDKLIEYFYIVIETNTNIFKCDLISEILYDLMQWLRVRCRERRRMHNNLLPCAASWLFGFELGLPLHNTIAVQSVVFPVGLLTFNGTVVCLAASSATEHLAAFYLRYAASPAVARSHLLHGLNLFVPRI